MAREKASYRDNIAAMSEWLHNKYSDSRRVFKAADIAEYEGVSLRTVYRRHPDITYTGWTVERYARAMS